MFKSFKRIFRKPTTASGPHTVAADEHGLTPADFSRGSRKVVEVLAQAGYQAYIVGGCIRDLLLGAHPKDFDVATDATPVEVKKLFRRSRIIGRRFRIVHVRMGPEIIEVTTFRAARNGGAHSGQQSSSGMLLRDNTFGSIEEDARRRDFTMNALYYHPNSNTIYDYADGIASIDQGEVRIIGDAGERYREDPVRMLRAIRFASKLGFKVEPATAKPIYTLSHLLEGIPAARLFDESLKLLLGGSAQATFNNLLEFDLFGRLFPRTAKQLAKADPVDRRFIEQALINTDKRIRSDKGVTPAFLLAALLWPVVHRLADHYRQQGESPPYALQRAAGEVLAEQCRYIGIPRRFTLGVREIWDMQLRLPRRAGKRAERLVAVPRFRAGYDFLLLREQAGEIETGLGEWWTRYQEADQGRRQKMVGELNKDGRGGSRNGNRRPRRRRKPT